MAIKVLIVDDSSFFRKRISDIISADPSMAVAGFAANGREAIKMTAELKPDVVTMDVEMPIMDGIEAVKGIMAETPTPIIMFSSLTKESADVTFNALEAGALDFITKNFDDIARNKEEALDAIRAKIKDIARKKYQLHAIPRTGSGTSSPVSRTTTSSSITRTANSTASSYSSSAIRSSGVTSSTTSSAGSSYSRPSTLGSSLFNRGTTSTFSRPSATSGTSTLSTRTTATSTFSRPTTSATPVVSSFDASKTKKTPVPMSVKEMTAATYKPTGKSYSIVAIGSSTGGPVALQSVVTALPANFPLPVVIVQHMPATFTTTFAQRLNKMSLIHVKEAENGDVLQPGHVYLAPGGKQLVIENKRSSSMTLKVSDSDLSINFKPCVDLTFASICNAYKGKVLAMILTGMGADGHDGCRLLKQNGATIWAQNEDTCVIYGMPQAIVNDSIAQITLPIQDIGACIVKEVMNH